MQQLEGGPSCRTANATRKRGSPQKKSARRSSAATCRTKARSATPKLPSKSAKTTAKRPKSPVEVLHSEAVRQSEQQQCSPSHRELLIPPHPGHSSVNAAWPE